MANQDSEPPETTHPEENDHKAVVRVIRDRIVELEPSDDEADKIERRELTKALTEIRRLPSDPHLHESDEIAHLSREIERLANRPADGPNPVERMQARQQIGAARATSQFRWSRTAPTVSVAGVTAVVVSLRDAFGANLSTKNQLISWLVAGWMVATMTALQLLMVRHQRTAEQRHRELYDVDIQGRALEDVGRYVGDNLFDLGEYRTALWARVVGSPIEWKGDAGSPSLKEVAQQLRRLEPWGATLDLEGALADASVAAMDRFVADSDFGVKMERYAGGTHFSIDWDIFEP